VGSSLLLRIGCRASSPGRDRRGPGPFPSWWEEKGKALSLISFRWGKGGKLFFLFVQRGEGSTQEAVPRGGKGCCIL